MKPTVPIEDPLLGQLVEGRYLVEAMLGRGGMATVYKVKESATGRVLAAKFLPPEHAPESEFQRRFEREAKAMARLDHPNVIRVHAVGMHGAQAYYMMDYLPHPDLDRLLRGGKALPPAEALEIGIGIGRALEYIHERGLVHRDLKPSNIVVLPGGKPILMDFGLVRDTERTQLTATGAVVGTPLYMSPELMKGNAAQRAGSMLEVAEKILSGSIVPLDQAAPQVGAPVAQLVSNLLAFEPGERYPSAKAFLADAVKVRRGQGVAATGPGSATPPGGTPGPTSVPPGRSGMTPLPRPLPVGSASGPRARSGAFAMPAGSSQPGLRSGGFTPTEAGIPGASTPVPVSPAALGAAGALVLVLALAWWAWPRDYRPTELRLEPSLTGFTAHWRTGSPAASSLEVRRPGEEWRLVRPEKDAAVAHREHEVRAGGFREGEKLEVRVLAPDGAAGAVEEVELSRLELKDLAAAALRPDGAGGGGPDRIAISFTSPVPVRCSLAVIGGDGRRREVKAESRDRLAQSFVLERPAADLAGLELRAELLDEGSELVRVDLAARLAAELEAGAGRIAAWELGPVIRERLTQAEDAGQLIGKFSAEEDKAAREAKVLEKRSALEEAFLAWLAARPEARWIRTAYALLPWVLSSRLVPVPARCRIYEALDHFFGLVWFARERGMRRLYEEVPVDWGDLGEYHEPGIGRGASYPIPVAPGLAFGTMSFEGKATLQEEFTVVLPRDPAPGKRAELSLAVERTLKDDLGIRVHVNDLVALSFYGIRSRLREGKAFVHRFPAEVLARGKNRLRVELLVQEGTVTTRQIHLSGLGLDVED